MSIRCNYIDYLVYVEEFDAPVGIVKPESPATTIARPCTRAAECVRYDNGIIVEAYCGVHLDEKRMSHNPSPNYKWERYSETKHYGAIALTEDSNASREGD